MELRFLRQEALDALQKSIGENISLYSEAKEDWTETFFLEKNIKVPLISSTITVPDFELITGEGASKDIENSIILYSAFKGTLKPVQVSDRRLWVALTHTSFYPYMIDRWPVENKLNDSGTNGTVTDHYFATRGLFRNGISRLYLLAELTYDESLEDHYEYTRYLMSYQDLINQVEGSSLCRNKKILRSILKTFKYAGSLSEQQKRLFFEGMNKRGGVRVLDALPPDELDSICAKTLDQIMGIKQITNGSKVQLQSVETEQKLLILVKAGKAYMGKSVLQTKPSNLYRLSVGNTMEIAKKRYSIIDIQ